MIRHWSGYGHVYAKRLDTFKLVNEDRETNATIVKVEGNHEQGLVPVYDMQCIEKWLGRFIPKDERLLYYEIISEGLGYREGIKTEYAIYVLASSKEA